MIVRDGCRSRLLVVPAPRRSRAVQFGATLDVGTGPATWDQVETDGARAQGTLGAFYRPARVLGLQPELSGDFGLSTEQPVRTALRWDVMGRLHTRGEVTGAWLGAGLGGVGTGTQTAALTRLEGGIRSGVGPAGFRVWLARTSFGVRPGVGGSLGNDSRRRHHRRRREAGRRIHRPGNARGPRLQPLRGRGHARPAVGKRRAREQCAPERRLGDECRLVGPAEPGPRGQRGAFASRAQPRAARRPLSIARRAPGARCPAARRSPLRRSAPPVTAARRRHRAPRPRDAASARHRGAGGGPRRGDGRLHRLAAPAARPRGRRPMGTRRRVEPRRPPAQRAIRRRRVGRTGGHRRRRRRFRWKGRDLRGALSVDAVIPSNLASLTLAYCFTHVGRRSRVTPRTSSPTISP